MRRLKVPDMRLLFPGSLLPQLDFVLVRRAPVVSTRQPGDLAVRIVLRRADLFWFETSRIHSGIGDQIQRLEKSVLSTRNQFGFGVRRSPFTILRSGFGVSGAQSEHR